LLIPSLLKKKFSVISCQGAVFHLLLAIIPEGIRRCKTCLGHGKEKFWDRGPGEGRGGIADFGFRNWGGIGDVPIAECGFRIADLKRNCE
jgi:hypothetical protein